MRRLISHLAVVLILVLGLAYDLSAHSYPDIFRRIDVICIRGGLSYAPRASRISQLNELISEVAHTAKIRMKNETANILVVDCTNEGLHKYVYIEKNRPRVLSLYFHVTARRLHEVPDRELIVAAVSFEIYKTVVSEPTGARRRVQEGAPRARTSIFVIEAADSLNTEQIRAALDEFVEDALTGVLALND